MNKAIAIAAAMLIGWASDQHYNNGHFADSLLSMLRQIRHSLGW